MLTQTQRQFTFGLFFVLPFVFGHGVRAQSSDAIDVTYSITVDQDRTGSVKIILIAPPTSAGFPMLCNPRPRSYPKEWNVVETATPTKSILGLGCIVDTQMEFSNIDALRKQLALTAAFTTTEEGSGLLISSKADKNPYPFQFRLNVKIMMPKILSYSAEGTLGNPIRSNNSISMSFMNAMAFEVRGLLGGTGVAQERRPYLGCWSNPDGVYLYITLKMMQFSQDHAVLNYVEVFSDINRNLYLLKVSNGDEFWGYLGLEVVGKRMNLNSYKSYEDFSNAKSMGEATWFNEDCDKVLPRLKP